MYETPNVINTDQKLLHNIQTLLKENNILQKQIIALLTLIKPIETEPIEVTTPVEYVKPACVRCGIIHDNKGQGLACAKKYKNMEVNK